MNITGGQGTSTVQVQYAQNGPNFIKSTISDACGNNNIVQQVNNWAGTPLINYPNLFLFDAGSNMWQFSHDYQPGATWNYYVAAGSATLQQNVGDCYITTQSGASVCVYGTNSCGTGATYCFDVPAGGGYMRSVSPNPGNDRLTVQFQNTASLKSLPTYVNLYAEQSTVPVTSIAMKEVYERKAFSDGDKLGIDVSALPRGIYYLHAIPDESTKQLVQRIRVVLE